MPARTPAEIDTLFASALNAGDLEALVSLYESNAALMPSPGNVVHGTAAIREALAGFLAAKPSMTLDARTLATTGDLALVSATWQLSLTGPDGKPATMNGNSVEVVRRQADGRWLFAIDFPFGASGDLSREAR
ncbi:MAG TPA: SgcJ/EcaC family oxidoreductase [Gemmatimonadaceae bacterium]